MFSPDSSTLLTGAGYTDSTIRLWDARNGQASGSLEGHGSWVSDLLFTPDGKLLLSSSADQTIRLWDWSNGKSAGVLRGHLDEVHGLALASDGRTLASRCKDGSIYLWDVTKPSRHLGYQTLPSRLNSWRNVTVFTPDSQSILGVEKSGGVALWDALTLKETRRLRSPSTNQNNIIISPDARWVAELETSGRRRVWDVRSGLESTNFIATPGPFGAWFTDNGKFLVTLYGPAANAVLEVRDTDTWQRKGSLTLHFKEVAGAFTPSLPNSWVIVADQAIHFFDVTKLNEAPKHIESGRSTIYGVVASPDGRTAADAGTEEGSIRLWDVATLHLMERFKGFLLGVHSIAFSPDGQRLAAGSSGQEAVKLWDAETRQEVLTLSGEGSLFYGLKFSPDGRYLLAINAVGLAHLWSAPTFAEIEAAETAEKQGQQR
jgi:WD40 repeat protein